jgi:hypothetical protein
LSENFNIIRQQWCELLLAEFADRIGAAGIKARGISAGRQTFTAVFLQAKAFPIPAADVLQEAIRIMQENGACLVNGNSFDRQQLDSVAMMGHRIGMVDSGASLKQYLLNAQAVLPAGGQILFTEIDTGSGNELRQIQKPESGYKQIEHVNLTGPFFSLLRIKSDALKNQTEASGWQCEFIYRQDETNYCALLNPANLPAI